MFESFRNLDDAIALAKHKSLDDNDDGGGDGDRKCSLFEVSEAVCICLISLFSRPKANSIILPTRTDPSVTHQKWLIVFLLGFRLLLVNSLRLYMS